MFTTFLLAWISFAPPPKATIDQAGWVAGCWGRNTGGRTVEEHWMTPAGGTMLGMSRTVANGKTTEYEFLRIVEQEGTLAYIALPSRQKEATFTLSTITPHELVFENPTHDFPTRIIYQKQPDGSLKARIEGTLNRQPRGIDFPMARCPS
jgi:Domain of unknown function (DUF6265)